MLSIFFVILSWLGYRFAKDEDEEDVIQMTKSMLTKPEEED